MTAVGSIIHWREEISILTALGASAAGPALLDGGGDVIDSEVVAFDEVLLPQPQVHAQCVTSRLRKSHQSLPEICGLECQVTTNDRYVAAGGFAAKFREIQ